MKKLRSFVLVLAIIGGLDFALAGALKNTMSTWKLAFPENNHRIRHEIYHHGLAANSLVEDIWGGRSYPLAVNSLGFKDRAIRQVPLASKFKRILFIGDSFTEGIGFAFKNSFFGHVAKELESRGNEILNAGVVSYAPSVYYNKLRYLLLKKGLKFDEVVLLLDISDAFDEATLYHVSGDGDGRLIVPPHKEKPLRTARHWLRDNSVITRTFYLARKTLRNIKKERRIRATVAKVMNKDPETVSDDEMRRYYTLSLPSAIWSFDYTAWNDFGRRGLEQAGVQMSRLKLLLDANNIPMTIVVYPWPIHLLLDPTGGRYTEFWKNWADKEKVRLLDLFDAFTSVEPGSMIDKYFIPQDVHWNELGQRFAAEKFLSLYDQD